MSLADPFALDVEDAEEDEEDEEETEEGAKWEHEDLAQVRIKVMRGHQDSVRSCQLCDKDSKLLTASLDHAVILWDFETGKSLSLYEGHTSGVSQARASPDAARFVSVGWDKNVYMWNTETGRVLWNGTHGGIVTCCAFSNDGHLVVTGSDLDYSVKIWDTYTGECIKTLTDLHNSTVTSCVFSPNDDRIITTSMDRTTRFYDLKSSTNTVTLTGHVNVVADASISKDERKLATVSWDKNITLWDVSTGMYRSQGPVKVEKAHEGSISSCCFSHDGTMLVTGGYDSTVALWDVVGEIPVQKLRLQGHGGWVEDVCYSKNGNWLLSCSQDKTVRLWNIEESDKIPQVLENRKSIGLKMYKCSTCGKPFSVTQLENPRDIDTCVFCRLQSPNLGRNPTPVFEDVSTD